MPSWIRRAIHDVDKLDYNPAVSTTGQVLDLTQIMLYSTPKRFQASAAAAGVNFLNTLLLSSGTIYVIVYACVSNNARPARGHIWLSPDNAALGLVPLGEGALSSGTNRAADAMANLRGPIILTPYMGMQIRDADYQAGDTVSVSVIYYAIEV